MLTNEAFAPVVQDLESQFVYVWDNEALFEADVGEHGLEDQLHIIHLVN